MTTPTPAFERLACAFQAELRGAPIFGLLGDGNMHCMSVLAEHGPSRFVSVNHEASAVAAADGYATASGDVGVATVTCGPGLTQVATSLVAAARGRSPLVLFAGDTPRGAAGDVQELDQARFAHACEATPIDVSSAESLLPAVARAFHLARNGGGPVVLNVPIDVQLADAAAMGEYHVSTAYSSTILPDRERLEELAAKVRSARRPMLLVGRGARASVSTAAVRALAERAGALIGTTMPCRGWLEDDPFSIGVVGGFASAVSEALCKESDLLLCIGASLDDYTTSDGALFPEAQVVHVDTARPRRPPTVSSYTFVAGDAGRVVHALTQLLPDPPASGLGRRTERTLTQLADARVPEESAPDLENGIDPRAVMRAIGEALPDDAVVVCGAGHFWAFPIQYLRLGSSASFFASYHFGSIGQTLPFAIGVAHAVAPRPVVAFDGDGSILMHIQELDTVARQRLPLKLFVINDRAFGAELHRMPLLEIDARHSTFERPSFAAVAEAFGVPGVEAGTIDALRASLDKGLTHDGPCVVDVLVSPDVVCSPYRRLYGEPNDVPLLAGSA
jgi:thiamine pyrophosphate-dependent acetolactate synthase large subunit-like protein